MLLSERKALESKIERILVSPGVAVARINAENGKCELYFDVWQLENARSKLIEEFEAQHAKDQKRIEQVFEEIMIIVRKELNAIEMDGVTTTCHGKLSQAYIDFKMEMIGQAFKGRTAINSLKAKIKEAK